MTTGGATVLRWTPLALLLVAGWAAHELVPWVRLTHWAAEQQRLFQTQMAAALRAVRAGDPAAIMTLCTATAAYGIVHAIGPGHGKVLIGGAALAGGTTLRRLAALTVVSSLAQAGTAIALVGLLVLGLKNGARDAAGLTETWLVPLSAAAMAGIGAVLVLRGVRALRPVPAAADMSGPADHHDHGTCGCGHAHVPSVEAVRSLRSTREAMAIVASIAIRPCTEALFVLVIAARFEVFAVGVLAVLAMASGTAATTLAVATGGLVARLFASVGQKTGSVEALRPSAALHILGGGSIVALGLLTLAPRMI